MTELERRALLGDAEAQRECTENGIVLPCPKCFERVIVSGPDDWEPTFYDPDSGGDPYEFDCGCGLMFGTSCYEFKQALTLWNTRPAPPIGKCGKCAKLKRGGSGYGWCNGFPKMFYQFCDKFTPKEDTK